MGIRGLLDIVHPHVGSSSPAREERAHWDGVESPWVLAAWAAAPWPVWSALSAVGVPGGAHSPAWLHGALALTLILTLMVVWAHRPRARAATRWALSILGTGIMGELLIGGLPGGFSGLDPLARALATWLLCVALYEVTPIVAAASRVSPREHRHATIDIGSHVLFAGLALAAYWQPRHGWSVSPFLAVLIALPLSAAQSGPRRVTSPPSGRRTSVVWGVALVTWALAGLLFMAEHGEVARSAQLVWRRGADPLTSTLLGWPAVSLVLALVAAATLFVRAARLRRAPSGRVVGLGDGGLTLEHDGEELSSVAIEGGALPAEGATVTLLGARKRPADVGPFRDGAPRWVATRAWVGAPAELSAALAHRAAGWLAWAAVSGIGIWIRLL